jgi:hypothetical protein
MWLLCSFQGPRGGLNAGRPPRALDRANRSRDPAGSGGRRSLKTQQHAGHLAPAPGVRPK